MFCFQMRCTSLVLMKLVHQLISCAYALSLSACIGFGLSSECCSSRAQPRVDPHSYDECVAAGYPITKTLPAKCITKDGIVFYQELSEVASTQRQVCKDRCGDGICQEIVCMALGCTCPETPETCAGDCKKDQTSHHPEHN